MHISAVRPRLQGSIPYGSASFSPCKNLANFCTDKNLHASTLRLHGTGGTGRIFERLSVQVWDLLFSGPKLARSYSFHIFRFLLSGKGLDLWRFMSKHNSDHYLLFCHDSFSHLAMNASLCMKL